MLVTDSQLKPALDAENIEWWGTAPLAKPATFHHYQNWIDKNYHGEMDYLKDHLSAKENPSTLRSNMRSAIFVAINYRPHPFVMEAWPLKALPVASYALGEDYHNGIKQRLRLVIDRLSQTFSGQTFLPMTDSHPVLERDFAHRAGLGWFGKNTCLIHKDRGSFFFIAEIFTSLEIQSNESPPPNMCGTCNRCIDACPTGAIVKPYELDSNRCISYWTIEARSNPPKELRAKVGQWFFGCDICQQVCPWNEKIYGRDKLHQERNYIPPRQDLIDDLRFILTTSNKELMRRFHGTAITRTGGRGLKRNAIMAAVHYGIHEVLNEIKLLDAENREIQEVVTWAIEQFSRQSETMG